MRGKTFCSLFLLVSIAASSLFAQASPTGQIGLYLDENHSEYCLDGTGYYQAEIWIWCQAGVDGQKRADFMIQYPDNVIASMPTYNTDIGVFVMEGTLDSGTAIWLEQCGYGWNWTHRQVIYVNDDQPSTIKITKHPVYGAVNFYNCEYYNEQYEVRVVSDLLVNCSNHVYELVSAETVIPQHVLVRFSRALDPTTAEEESNYEVFLASNPSEFVPVTGASLQINRTDVSLLLGERLEHGNLYTLRVNNVQDEHGNEIDPDESIQFTAIDRIPPVPLTEERITDLLLHIGFDEYLDPASAQNAGNYSVAEVRDSLSTVPVSSVALAPDSVSVEIAFAASLADSLDYIVWIVGVEDRHGNATVVGTGIVTRDIAPPVLLEAWAEEPPAAVWARFNEQVNAATAEDHSNYRLFVTANPADTVAVTSAEIGTDISRVRLTLSEPLPQQTGYTLRAMGIADLAGNVDTVGSEAVFTTHPAEFTLLIYEETMECVGWDPPDCEWVDYERAFASSQASIYEELGTPGPSASGYDGYDFVTLDCEYYDVFFSDAAGIPLGIEPGDELPDPTYITIECMALDCSTMYPGPALLNNLTAVVVHYADRDLIGVELTRYIYGLFNEHVARKRDKYVWNVLGSADYKEIIMGGGFSSVTIRLADEPPPPVIRELRSYDPDFMGIVFSNNLDQETAEDANRYAITREADPLDSVGIVSAEFVRTREVYLTFAEPLADDTVYTLGVIGVEDVGGTPSPNGMEVQFVMIDDRHPRVVGAKRIDAWTVGVKYSEEVQAESATDPNNYIIEGKYDDSGNYVDVASASLAASGDSVTLIMADSLDVATSYTVMAVNVLDLHDNPVASSEIWLRAIDDVPPRVVGAERIDSWTVGVKYSEKVQTESATNADNYSIESAYKDGNYFVDVASASLAASGDSVTLILADSLDIATSYSMVVADILDLYGNPVAANQTWLKEYVRPYPIDVQVETLLEIVIHYSEWICYDGEESSYRIYRTDDTTAVMHVSTVGEKPANNTVRLHLESMLENGINYTIEIIDVRDCAGNVVAPGTSITFDALGDAPPYLLLAEATDAKHVMLTFSERLDETTAETVSNYELSKYEYTSWMTADIESAELQSNALDVVLTLADSLRGTVICELLVTGVTDESGTPVPVGSFKEFIYHSEELGGIGYMALFADSNRVSFGAEGEVMYQVEMWIWCRPSENGQMCAEFAIDYPANTIPSTRTQNDEVVSHYLGDLTTGMSVCYLDCQNDWNWPFHQTIYVTSPDTTEIAIVGHPDTDEYVYASCGPPYPTELIVVLHGLFLNRDAEVATMLQSSSVEYAEHGVTLAWSLSRIDENIEFFISRAAGEDDNFIELTSPDIEHDGLAFAFVDRDFERGSAYRYRIEYAVDGGDRMLLLETEPVQTPGMPLTLWQNYPNPFNPSTTISYYLPENCLVGLDIYDISGRRIVCLVNKNQPKGDYRIDWNGTDAKGNFVASGIYFYRLRAGKNTITKKMVLLK